MEWGSLGFWGKGGRREKVTEFKTHMETKVSCYQWKYQTLPKALLEPKEWAYFRYEIQYLTQWVLIATIEIPVSSSQVKIYDIYRHLKNDKDIHISCHKNKKLKLNLPVDEDTFQNTNHEAEENDHKTLQQKINIGK